MPQAVLQKVGAAGMPQLLLSAAPRLATSLNSNKLSIKVTSSSGASGKSRLPTVSKIRSIVRNLKHSKWLIYKFILPLLTTTTEVSHTRHKFFIKQDSIQLLLILSNQWNIYILLYRPMLVKAH